jgi:hypothetical protein
MEAEALLCCRNGGASLCDRQVVNVSRERTYCPQAGRLTNCVAVALLIAAMVRTKHEDLFRDHTEMADFIRQRFGMWDGNAALIKLRVFQPTRYYCY